MNTLNFATEKSFFEHLGIANLERVHTEFLAWILSEHCLAISIEEKSQFISDLVQSSKF